MPKSLYDRTLALAQSKFAESWLAVIAFIESSFFPIPADVVYFPMALAAPERAYRYALTATLASTLGGIAGYYLGYYALELIAVPLLELYGRLEEFETLRRCAGRETTMLLLLTSGLAHLPPIKIVTILSGVVDVGIIFFIASCITARGARFFALAYALRRWGAPISSFIERRPWLLAGIVATIVITIYLAFKFLIGSSTLLACP
jgi:membrane protein YqaA with SNARE-associated domain